MTKLNLLTFLAQSSNGYKNKYQGKYLVLCEGEIKITQQKALPTPGCFLHMIKSGWCFAILNFQRWLNVWKVLRVWRIYRCHGNPQNNLHIFIFLPAKKGLPSCPCFLQITSVTQFFSLKNYLIKHRHSSLLIGIPYNWLKFIELGKVWLLSAYYSAYQ